MDSFCSKCEAILISSTTCECGHKNQASYTSHTTRVWVNRRKHLLKPNEDTENAETEGPKVEKYCEKCNLLTLQSYFTAQLRSADEGQTVFYRCTKCLIQTSENS